MIQLSNEDYVLLKDGQPIESLDVIYHYTSVVELFNHPFGFNLKEGEEFVCMTDLSPKLQKEYLKELSHEVESMCVNCGSVPEKVTFCEERDADFCESCF